MSSCEEVPSIINGCFAKINETHSFIMPVMNAANYTNNKDIIKEAPALYTRMGPIAYSVEKDNIGYLSVPWVATTDAATCTLIADSIQSIIELLDSKGISSWIIDLRKNTGGNCWPMLAGLGPLIGEGICGYFVSPDSKSPWRYKDGASINGNSIVVSTSKKGYQLINPVKKIAVLIGPKTSSSGEIAALAFKGKENTSFFGEPSAGFTTANSTYPLRDGSMLVLTVCKEADRTGKVCEGKIIPDERVSVTSSSKENDPAKNAALRWLETF
jgi:C-terminal processing protease CtpA/Prc